MKPLHKRLGKLFAMLGSDNAGERENARTLIDEILRKNRKSWNDLTELLQNPAADTSSWTDDDETESAAAPVGANINALDLTHALLKEYLELKEHEYIVVALWALHTHIYDQFRHTPRLVLTSPVRGCGKTVVLEILDLLVLRGRKDDSITAAAFIRLIDRQHPTMLVDEGDNLGLERDNTLRAVFNSGYQKGGKRTLVVNDLPRSFSVFAPLAIAAISALPLPLMSRAIIIHMERAKGPLRAYDGNDAALNHAYAMIRAWARDVKLNPAPKMPDEFRNRAGDKWRALISVADSFGRAWGAHARKAMTEFARVYGDEDIAIVLLEDIRTIFDTLKVDGLPSATLVEELIAIEDSSWGIWRGLKDDQQPRPLTQGELARVLGPFGIRPKSIWPRKPRTRDSKSNKGYLRSQFEQAWRAYCDSAGTPAQPNKFPQLRRK